MPRAEHRTAHHHRSPHLVALPLHQGLLGLSVAARREAMRIGHGPGFGKARIIRAGQ
jgi:hypothetical protein